MSKFKIMIRLALISCLIILQSLKVTNNNFLRKITKVNHISLYINRTNDGREYSIQLDERGNGFNGVFLGSEFNSDSTKVYFRSLFEFKPNSLAVGNNDNIFFILKSSKFSYKPFSFNSVEKEELITDKSKVPFLYNYRVSFRGKIYKDTFELHRTMEFYDSNSDLFYFKKISD